MKTTISFKEAILYWLKLGFISFGGPAAQISMMHEEIVEKKKWIDDKSFFHALNFTMILLLNCEKRFSILIRLLFKSN